MLLVWLGAVAASASCASAQARTAADRPDPGGAAGAPARMIEPTGAPNLRRQNLSRIRRPPAPPNPKPRPPANREPARSDPKPEAPAAEVPQAPRGARYAAPAASDAQRRWRGSGAASAHGLDRASKALKLVDHKRLSNARRKITTPPCSDGPVGRRLKTANSTLRGTRQQGGSDRRKSATEVAIAASENRRPEATTRRRRSGSRR